MSKPPKMLRAIGWILFGVVSIAIHYQVKFAMHAGGSGSVQTLGHVKVGDNAPDFTVQDLSGHNVALSAYRGQKVVLMDFWATWCGPCRMAMPGLQDIADKYKGGGIELLSVNQGESAEDAGSFIQRKKYTFHVVLDKDQAVGNQYGVQAIPTLILVDKKGVIRYMSVGYSSNDDEVEKLVDKLIKE